MWVGAEGYLQGLREQWPCPDRVLNAPKSLLESVGLSATRPPSVESAKSTVKMTVDFVDGAERLLQSTREKITGLNRWACSKPTWNVDLDHNKNIP